MTDDAAIRKAEYLRGTWRGCDKCHRNGARACYILVGDATMDAGSTHLAPERLMHTFLCTDCWIGYLKAIKPTGLEKVGLR